MKKQEKLFSFVKKAIAFRKDHPILHMPNELRSVDYMAKGFPDVYENAAAKLGLAPMDCVVYEDILKGVEGAKLGGFYVVGVEDIHSGYERNQIKEGSDCYISSFRELYE